MQLTKNFKLAEFSCKDGSPVAKKYIANVQKLANNLQVLRDEIKEPIFINSGYRTPAYNAKVGGAKQSQHLYAKAGDIRVNKLSPRQVHTKIEQLIKAGKMHNGGLGLYNNFVHYDVRPNPARWNNTK